MSKSALLAQVNESGGSFIFLTHSKAKFAKRIGYVHSEKELKAHIAAYSAERGVTSVKAVGGRNIMDEDGPSATFTVSVSIK